MYYIVIWYQRGKSILFHEGNRGLLAQRADTRFHLRGWYMLDTPGRLNKAIALGDQITHNLFFCDMQPPHY